MLEQERRDASESKCLVRALAALGNDHEARLLSLNAASKLEPYVVLGHYGPHAQTLIAEAAGQSLQIPLSHSGVPLDQLALQVQLLLGERLGPGELRRRDHVNQYELGVVGASEARGRLQSGFCGRGSVQGDEDAPVADVRLRQALEDRGRDQERGDG
jgi:hypothetical protein